ncbi:hypothetical protein D3C72_2201270 [compost metagenome]
MIEPEETLCQPASVHWISVRMRAAGAPARLAVPPAWRPLTASRTYGELPGLKVASNVRRKLRLASVIEVATVWACPGSIRLTVAAWAISVMVACV